MIYKCAGCEYNSKYRSNVNRHIKSCLKNVEKLVIKTDHLENDYDSLLKTYEKYKLIFDNNDCILLTSFEEFKNFRTQVNEIKYINVKYIASCTHENNISLVSYINNECGRRCKKCIKDDLKKLSKNADGSARLTKMEDDGIEYIYSILKDKFDIKLTDECCLSDFVLKPLLMKENEYLQIQIKTTEKPNKSGYRFKASNKYSNMLIICLCLCDKKIWLLDGNNVNCSTGITIAPMSLKYKETLCINLNSAITEFYDKLPKFPFEHINIPITRECRKEQDYKKYRETICNLIKFEYPKRRGLVYDFMINEKRIQEKTGFVHNENSKNIRFLTYKGKRKPYEIGDNDFYWLHCPDKEHFLIIPEKYIVNKTTISIDLRILDDDFKNIKSDTWWKKYVYKYSTVDQEELIDLFS